MRNYVLFAAMGLLVAATSLSGLCVDPTTVSEAMTTLSSALSTSVTSIIIQWVVAVSAIWPALATLLGVSVAVGFVIRLLLRFAHSIGR